MKKVLTLGVVLTTMLWTMGLAAFVPTASAETLSAGDLFKTPDNTAVYYYAEDGTKYVFPTASTYFSWYPDFEGQTIKELDSQENMAIDLAGNVMMRAGTKLIQFIDDTGQVISNKIYAVEPDGVLRHLDGEAAAEALYGADWSDKIVKVSQYLFDNYTVSSEALDGSEYPEGSLVSKGDTTYYVNEDGSWSEVTAEGMTANNFMTDYVEDTSMDMPSAGDDITNTHEALVDVSQGGGAGDGGSVAAGTLGVALNANTPATGVVPTNASAAAANVVFTKVDLTAGADAVTVTGLKVTRGGLSNNAAVDTVKLYDGSNQIGSSQSLNSSNQAVFNNISVDVSANETKVLTIVADMTASASYDGNIITLGIEEASDVTTTAAVSGSFPVTGNSQTLNSGITIGSALLYDGSLGNRNGTDLTVDTDATDVRFVQVKVKAGSAEGITINQVTAVKNGTAAASDVKNIRLVNDDTGETLGTVNSLNSSGRAIFNTDVEVSKGDNVELSILADMNKSGAGRTLTFDLHDGTNYTIDITGNTYGYGITPTRSNFCLSGGTCTAQSINQGYLTASLSADTPATGNVALGSTEVPLLTYDVIANGEDINVTQTQIDITTVTAERDQVTQVTIYDEDGKIVAGPKDCTTASAGTESLTFTDAYTIPNGETSYTVKADLATDMTANDDVYAALKANGITAKGADSGKTTYTTSTTSGGTVPPTNVITGKTQTIRGPKLDVNTAATPVASTFVVNSQDVELAYFDLNATAGGEDIKVSQIVVTDTKNGSAAYADWGNLEL